MNETDLNEMLGELDHILSDETGTFIKNIMKFIGRSASGKRYKPRGRKPNLFEAVKQNVQPVKCHIVVPDVKSDFDDDLDLTKKERRNIIVQTQAVLS